MAETLIIKEYQNAKTMEGKNSIIVKAIRLDYPNWVVNLLKTDFIKHYENK